jgi:hypothetical protein
MNRRTVDITVDAYDAPMLAALAKLREAHRARGLADDEPHVFMSCWLISDEDGRAFEAASLKRLRERQEQQRADPRCLVDANLIIAGEFMELVEARSLETRLHELLDVMGSCARQWSRLQRAKVGA